jgi:hypothetical protein
MTGTATDLLRQLGSGVRPLGPSGPARPSTIKPGELETAGFADLLAAAKDDGVQTGLNISIAPGADVRLTPEQLARLSAAADRAQAAGVHEALVMIDGQALKLDVFTRTITGKAELGDGNVLSGFDGLMVIPATDAVPAAAAKPVPPPATTGNASVQKLLAKAPPRAPADNAD